MSTPALDDIVREYLLQLDAALRGIPERRRQQLVDEVRSHIAEGRALLEDPTEADIRTLLERLGPPEEIADETLTMDRPAKAPPRRRLWMPVGVAAVLAAVGLAVGLTVALSGGTSGRPAVRPPTPTTTTITSAVVLPTLKGDSASTAAATLTAVGLRSVVQHAPSTVAPQGAVVAQAPAAGAKVVLGSTVTLTVSSGPPPS